MTRKPAFTKWISPLAALGFLVFILYFLFFTDLKQVAVVIEGINVLIYLLSFACVIGVALFSALTWKAALDIVGVKTTFRRVFNLNWVGIFVDSLIPGGLAGDLFMTYLMSKDEGVDGAKVLASVIIKDVLELVVILGSLIVGMVLLVLNYSINSLLLIAIGITLTFLALPLFLIIYLSTNVSATKKLLRLLVGAIAKIRKKPFITTELESKITDFHDGIMSIKSNSKAIVKPIVFQTIAWVFEILALYFVFVALGSEIAADKILITNTVVSTIRDQGVVLAGFSQIVSSQLYGVLGINLSLAQASSLLAGLANFWLRLVVSFVFFQTYGLGTIAEKLLNRAFKEKTKKDKKDFKEQTDSNQKDFEEKTDSNRKDFEKLRDDNEIDYKEHQDNAKRDFEAKTDTARKNFEKQRDSNEIDYKEHQDNAKRDFEEKTDSDKSERTEQRDIHRKEFKEKTDIDKKDFEKLRDNNETDYKEYKDTNQKDFEAKADSDKSDYKEQKECDKKDFIEKIEKDKKDFKDQKDSKEETTNDKKDSEK